MYDQTTTSTPRESHRSSTPRPDPLAPLPGWVRPGLVSYVLGAIYGAGALTCIVTLMLTDLDEVDEGILAWGIASVVLSVPLAVVISLLSHRVERVQTGRVGEKAWLWLPYAVGAAQWAHWAPACLWSPVLLVAAMVDGDADDRLAAAVVGMFAWIAAGVALVVSVGCRRVLEGRDWGSARSRPILPALVPSSLVLLLGYAVAIALPTLLWLAWLDEAWTRGAGAVGMLAFLLFSGAAALLGGALTGSWLLAVAPHAPAAAYGTRMRQFEVTGAAFTAHWAVLMPVLLLPGMGLDEDLRYSLLFAAFFAVVAGTSLWSIGRTLRVQQTIGAT